MLKSGALEDMNKRNIEWVFIGPVDNPLVNMVDPIFVAIAATKKCMAAGKSVVKARPEERVGVFCKRKSKPSDWFELLPLIVWLHHPLFIVFL